MILPPVDNTIMGHLAFDAADGNERQNVVIGSYAGSSINTDTSDDNVLIGHNAGLGGGGTTEDCVVIGASAMDGTGTNTQTGTVAIGYFALSELTSGMSLEKEASEKALMQLPDSSKIKVLSINEDKQ